MAMLLAGHNPKEPHLYSLLMGIKKGKLMQLKNKAKLTIPDARLLLGVCDQVAKLAYGQVTETNSNTSSLCNSVIGICTVRVFSWPAYHCPWTSCGFEESLRTPWRYAPVRGNSFSDHMCNQTFGCWRL